MRRHVPAVALGAVLALAALAFVFVLGPEGPESTPAERADALARELRCPDCQGLSVADSPTSSAREIRRQLAELVAGGASDQDVRDHFVDRYGDWILLAPSSPLPWILPLAMVSAATVAMVIWLARQARCHIVEPAATPEERRIVRDEAEALDA